MSEWNTERPIYRQLKDKIEHLIIDGSLKEGEAVPSVRQIAVDERINPLTVSRAYQLLVEEGILEARRGLGMFVLQGAAKTTLRRARENFLNNDWPRIHSLIERLGFEPEELLKNSASTQPEAH